MADAHDDHGQITATHLETIQEGGAVDGALNFLAVLSLIILLFFCGIMITAHPQEAQPELRAQPASN